MRSHPVDPQRILRSLLTERWQSRTTVVLVSLAAAILGLIAPYSQKQFVDLLTRGHPSLHWIWIAFGSALGYQCLNQLALWLSSRESVYSQKALGEALFSRMLAVRGGLIGHRPAGEAVSLFAVDVPGAAGILDQCLSTGASLFFPILLAPLALRHFFGIPLGASLGAITAIGGVNVVLALRQSRFFYRFKQLAAERTGLVAEWVGNIRTLRILGWTESVEQRIFAVRQRETRNRIAMVTNGQLMNSIAGSATYVVNVLAVAALVRLRGTGVTPGELLALLWILGVFLARPLRQFPWFFVIGLDAISSIRRLQAALAVESPSPRIEIREKRPLSPLLPDCALEVRGLRLEIEGKELLQEIDLCLTRGEFIAIIGEVGSGKSLLLQSLMGETGARFDRFALDGQSTAGPSDPQVRERFAFVPQEGFTMSANLRENVLFEYDAGNERDSTALASLAVAQFIPQREGMAQGLETEIGERGVNLSGGQRQRIGLARSHFSNRSVILLDDSLSAVDVDTERRLTAELLQTEWRGRARILATHRMSVLPACDRVLFMEQGRIILEGTHEGLMRTSSQYRGFVVSVEKARAKEQEDSSAAHRAPNPPKGTEAPLLG